MTAWEKTADTVLFELSNSMKPSPCVATCRSGTVKAALGQTHLDEGPNRTPPTSDEVEDGYVSQTRRDRFSFAALNMQTSLPSSRSRGDSRRRNLWGEGEDPPGARLSSVPKSDNTNTNTITIHNNNNGNTIMLKIITITITIISMTITITSARGAEETSGPRNTGAGMLFFV